MSDQVIDTNIFVYAIDADSQFYTCSRAKLLAIEDTLYTAIKNFSEFLAVVTRKNGVSLTLQEAFDAIESFRNQCTMLYPTPQSTGLFYQLLREYNATELRGHDVEIASIALTNNLSQMVTFNTIDFAFIDGLECLEAPAV